MFIGVKSLTRHTALTLGDARIISQALIPRIASCQHTTLDFLGVTRIGTPFFQELFYRLVSQCGPSRLHKKVAVINIKDHQRASLLKIFSHVEHFFDAIHDPKLRHDEELYQLNLSWLIKIRDLIKTDKAHAALITGIGDPDFLERIDQLKFEEIHQLSSCSWLCFTPRFSKHMLDQFTTDTSNPIRVMLGMNHITEGAA